MNAKLIHGDCIKVLDKIKDESINMILCDLPYGGGTTGNEWDKRLDLQELFKQYRRIIKEDGCIALNGNFKFGVELYNAAPDLYKYDVVWQKDNGTNAPSVNYQPFRTHEFVFIFGKGRVSPGTRIPMKYYPQKTQGKPYSIKPRHREKMSTDFHGDFDNIGTDNPSGLRHPTTIQFFCRDKEKLHVTQKPVALCEWLIKTYTDEGDVVLDNCMGSGSSGVAALKCNRKFIGIEMDDKYFEIAKERIKNA